LTGAIDANTVSETVTITGASPGLTNTGTVQYLENGIVITGSTTVIAVLNGNTCIKVAKCIFLGFKNVVMYITEVLTKTKDGKISHVCILLRESYRENGKVKNKTIANLTNVDKDTVEALKIALKNPKQVLSNIVNPSSNLKIQLILKPKWFSYTILLQDLQRGFKLMKNE
jgi:hypothetical protein